MIAVVLVVEVARSAHLAQNGTRDPVVRATGSASSRGMGPRAIRPARSSPSTSSMMSAELSVVCSKRWICAMQGWFTGGEEFRLALEPAKAVPVRGDGHRQDLQRDVALQFRVAGLVNFAHAPGANELEDLVRDPAGCQPR
jgi:hypothetical protein